MRALKAALAGSLCRRMRPAPPLMLGRLHCSPDCSAVSINTAGYNSVIDTRSLCEEGQNFGLLGIRLTPRRRRAPPLGTRRLAAPELAAPGPLWLLPLPLQLLQDALLLSDIDGR